jgi:hypothetical protein
VLSGVVKNDKRVFVEKTLKDPAFSGKVFCTFRLRTAPKLVQIFPILGTDFCVKLAANKQLGSLNAHPQYMLLKINIVSYEIDPFAPLPRCCCWMRRPGCRGGSRVGPEADARALNNYR